MSSPVVTGGDQHAREPPNPAGVGLGIRLEQVEEAVSEQGDALAEKFLDLR